MSCSGATESGLGSCIVIANDSAAEGEESPLPDSFLKPARTTRRSRHHSGSKRTDGVRESDYSRHTEMPRPTDSSRADVSSSHTCDIAMVTFEKESNSNSDVRISRC